MGEDKPYGLCPWYGGECPGQHNCAPARYGAVPGEDGTPEPRCPITMSVDSLSAIAMVVYPILEQTGVLKKRHDVSDREAFIREVVQPDQHRE